jgi:tetraacyldisaccharide 4'-kinase
VTLHRPPAASRWELALQAFWWGPPPSAGLRWLAAPLQGLWQGAAGWQRWRARATAPAALPVPVVVVGNLIVGGAGKTPTTMALVHALRQRGWRPGIVSRGYGGAIDRAEGPPTAVGPDHRAADVGDEPLLMARRSGAPVVVGRRRLDAARLLLRTAPGTDVIVCDDGLQHAALPRDVEVVVFDARGTGNGLLLPLGPLREPLARATRPGAGGRAPLVLYNAPAPSTAVPGALARRALAGAVPLADWWAGRPFERAALAAFVGRPCHAAAGLAQPARFFDMLRAEGLTPTTQALPDHDALDAVDWPAGDVLVTEKDAVKLPPTDARRPDGTRLWVVGLDFQLPDDFVDAVAARLPARGTR